MKTVVVFVILLLIGEKNIAQVAEPSMPNTEQQLENITENNADIETEDDTYLQQMQEFLRNPVELNVAGEAELNQLRILTPVQIQNFLIYRKQVGKLIDVYELQAVPGWDIGTIQKIRLYVSVSTYIPVTDVLRHRLKNGEHSILLRASQILERSKGFMPASPAAINFYPGSPQKYLFRYKYTYRNLFQYGIIAEKDAGEQFFKGKQRQGFDFYSAHIFFRKTGPVKALALGDFTVNLGQGLTQWQNLAFKKSADAMFIKREGEILQP